MSIDNQSFFESLQAKITFEHLVGLYLDPSKVATHLLNSKIQSLVGYSLLFVEVHRLELLKIAC